jgi:inorganic pyrophosphatase
MKTEFWSRLDELIKSSEIVIDRPKGTPHPKYPDLIFPLDYGYLKGTSGGDGDGIIIRREAA